MNIHLRVLTIQLSGHRCGEVGPPSVRKFSVLIVPRIQKCIVRLCQKQSVSERQIGCFPGHGHVMLQKIIHWLKLYFVRVQIDASKCCTHNDDDNDDDDDDDGILVKREPMI